MAVSYKKLWKMLIDKDMKKKDLCAKAGISTASVTKMGKGGHNVKSFSNCKARMKQFEESRKQHKEECIWLH